MTRTIKATFVATIVAGSMVSSLSIAGADDLVSGGANGVEQWSFSIPAQPIGPQTVPGATIPGVTIPGMPLPATSGGTLTINGQQISLPGTPSSTPGQTVPGATVPSTTAPGATIPGGTLTLKFLGSNWAVTQNAPASANCPPGQTPAGIYLSGKRPGVTMEVTFASSTGESKSFPVNDAGGQAPGVGFFICK